MSCSSLNKTRPRPGVQRARSTGDRNSRCIVHSTLTHQVRTLTGWGPETRKCTLGSMAHGERASGAGGAAAVAGRNARPAEPQFDGAEDSRRFKEVTTIIDKKNRYRGRTKRVIFMEKVGEIYQPIRGEDIYCDSDDVPMERIPFPVERIPQ